MIGFFIAFGLPVLAGAITITGQLTLDGGNDPDAVFVIRSTAGAINAAGTCNVTLTNGAKSSNVYWVAQGTVGIAAGATIDGTIISNTAPITVGTGSSISGRLLTNSGLITFNWSTCTIPTDPSFIDMRSLSSFSMYTGAGAMLNTLSSTIVGDIGTNLGAVTGFDLANMTGTIYYPGITSVSTTGTSIATFSIYSNGVLIPSSVRDRANLALSKDVYLQAIATITAGHPFGENIDVRVKIDNGTVTMNSRILSFIKIQ